jgi:hypothetical protein
MAKNKTDLSFITKLIGAKNFVAAFEALSAIKLQADPAAKSLAAELLRADYWTENTLEALPISQQTRFFAMGRLAAADARATNISRTQVLRGLWNSQDVEDWQTLLKLIQSGSEQPGTKQMVNVARVRARLHLKQPAQDLAAVVPFLSSAFATFLATQRSAAFSEQLEQLFLDIIEPCITASISSNRAEGWRELVRLEIPQMARVYAHCLQHCSAVLDDPDFVLLAPSYFVDKASRQCKVFSQLLQSFPAELQEAYTPQAQERNFRCAGLADPGAHLRYLEQLPTHALNIRARWMLSLQYCDEIKAETKFTDGIFCFPEAAVRKLIERCPDDVTRGQWEEKLAYSLGFREFSQLIYSEKVFWNRYKPDLTTKTPVGNKIRFLKMLIGMAKFCAETGNERASHHVYSVLNELTNSKTTRKPLLPYLPHGRDMKSYLNCACSGCVGDLGRVIAITLANKLQESHQQMFFAWPEINHIVDNSHSRVSNIPIGSLNAFSRLDLTPAATKKDILERVMIRMRHNPEKMPALREAQSQLFNTCTRVTHEFFFGLD